jgi:hypothetical protein
MSVTLNPAAGAELILRCAWCRFLRLFVSSRCTVADTDADAETDAVSAAGVSNDMDVDDRG